MTPGRPPATAPEPHTADQATEDAMSNATTVSPAHSASTASTLITNIAALVTNDPSLGDGSPSDWSRTPRSPSRATASCGPVIKAKHPPLTIGSTQVAGPSSPA